MSTIRPSWHDVTSAIHFTTFRHYLLLWTTISTPYICGAASLQMMTKGQFLVIKSGENATLECEFYTDSFNLFDNPIVWRKTQRHEETQINMMSNLLEPFASARRFRPTFQQHKPRFVFGLSITNVSLEDNGNYTCEISGPHNTLLGSITHRMFVRAPVDRILITAAENASASPPASILMTSSNYVIPAVGHNHSAAPVLGASAYGMITLVYVENQPSLLRCVALGGSPPPDVDVYIGQTNITDQLSLTRHPTVTRHRGLRLVYYTTERSTNHFVARPSDDGETLRCVVTVPGSSTNASIARITVHYAPVIVCDETAFTVGERNVFIKCDIRSRPALKALFWVIDNNGTELVEGQVVNGYWTLTLDQHDIIESQLYIRQVSLDTFRQYKLVAENSVAIRTQDVRLVQKVQKRLKVESPPQRSVDPQKPSVGFEFVDLFTTNVANARTLNCQPLVTALASACLIISTLSNTCTRQTY